MSRRNRSPRRLSAGSLRRGVSLLLTTVLVSASMALVYGVAGPAPQAHALEPFTCPNVYSLQGAAPRNIWEVDVDSGAQTSVGSEFTIASGVTGNLNGLGISADGGVAIGVINASTGNGRLIYQYDRASDTTALLGSGVDSTPITHGAIDPASGVYYYGGVTSGTLNVYGFDPETGANLGRVAHGPVPNNGGNGDFAFDRQGRLYVVAGNPGSSIFSVVNQPIPTTATDITITATEIADIPAPQAINGIGYSGTGYLYVSSSDTIYQINPSTGAVVESNAFSETGSVDLASCATPNTIVVQKNFPSGRVAPSDQATVTVTGGGLTQGNTGTTTGTEPGLQTEPGEVAGPVLGLTGTTYSISETGTGTNAGSYVTSWRCIDQNNGGAVVAQGSGTAGSFAMPDGGSEGAAIVCTFTNDAKLPAVSIDKQAGPVVDTDLDGLTDAGDTITYTFVVTNSGNLTLGSVAVLDAMVGTVTCPPGALAPGEFKTCTAAPYVLSQADVDRGAVDNTATATGDPVDPSVGDVFSAPDDTHTDLPSQPSLVLDKIAAPPVDANGSGLTDANDTIEYTFHVVNRGNVTISQLRIADPMLAALTCPVLVLAPGEETTCTAATYTITTADEVAGEVDNTAVAQGVEAVAGADVESLPDSTSTPVQVPEPELTVEKSAGTPVDVNSDGLTNAGDTITYTFTVTNSGDVPLSGVTVIDPRLSGVSCVDTTLAPDDVTTCSAPPYTITPADELAGSVVNTAVATGDDPDGEDVTSDPDSTTTVVTPAAPELTLEKDAGAPVDVNDSGITDAGDTIQYTFTVRNDGNVTITDIVVEDVLAGPVTCAATTLAPDEETTCSADEPYVITAADETAEIVTNTATTVGRDPGGDQVESDPDSTNTPVTPQAPALTLDKEAGTPVDTNSSGLTDAGDTIQYTFRLTNDGNVPLSGLTVLDPLAGAVTCAETSLAPTVSTTCTADEPYVVTEADELEGDVVNVATALAADPDGDDVTSNQDSTTTQVQTPAPELTFDKQAGTPVDANGSGITDAGDTIAYSFTVTNDGNVPISDISVSDPKAGAATCDLTTLAPGQSALCTADELYVVTEADETAGSADNTARATGTDPDGDEVPSDPDSTTTTVTTPDAVLVIDKQAGTPVDVNGSGITDAGDTIAYSFTVTNAGNVPISDISVDDPKAGNVTCEAERLEPGTDMECVADELYVVTEADEVTGSVDNTARATGTDPDGDEVPSEPDSTTTTVTTPNPALTIDKQAGAPVDVNGNGLADAGDTIAYSFTVTNDGNVPISDISVSDLMAGAVTCDRTTLAPGQSALCAADALYVVTEADEVTGSVDNTARATGTDPDDDEVPSDPDSTSTAVTRPDPSLVIDKTGDHDDANGNGVADEGETVTYGFTVTNTGNMTLYDVAVSDDRVTGLAPASVASLAPGAVQVFTADPYVVTAADAASGTVLNVASASGETLDGTAVESATDEVTFPSDSNSAALGDRVWFDYDRDGHQDPREPGAPGVRVQLLDATGAVVATQRTSTSAGSASQRAGRVGTFLFDHLPGGTYSVRFDAPGDHQFTQRKKGGLAADSDAARAHGRTAPVVLGIGEQDRTIDAGLRPQFDLVLRKSSVSGPRATVGDLIRYRLQVSNRGPDAALGRIKLTDRLPDGLDVRSARGKGWSCTVRAAADIATCVRTRALGADRKAAPVIVVAQAKRAAVGRVVNRAQVTAGAGETVRSNGNDSAGVRVAPVPPLPSTGYRYAVRLW